MKCCVTCVAAVMFVMLTLSSITLAGSPGNLDDLYLWLQQDTLTGLADGDAVASWADSSPSNTPMATVGGQPTYSSSGINGHPSVHFDFSDGHDTMAAGDGALLAGNPEFTLMVLLNSPREYVDSAGGIVQNIGSNGYHAPVNWGNGNAPQTGSTIEVEFGGSKVDWATGWGKDATTGAGSYDAHWGEPTIISIRKTPGPTNNARISLDGTEQDVGGSSAIPRIANSPVRLGGGGGFGNLTMDVGEVILYTRSLSDAEENSVGAYLERKYGLDTAYDDPNAAVFALTVEVSPPGAGIDTVVPAVGTHDVDGGGQAISASRFVACPDVFVFDHWEGDDVADPSDPQTTVFVDADKTVTAVFMDGRACPDECRDLPAFDFDGNCIINLIDFAAFAADWLMDFNPQ